MTQETRPLGLKAPNRGVRLSGRVEACIRIRPKYHKSAWIQTRPSSAYIKAAFEETRSRKSALRTAWRWTSSLSHLLSSWGNPTVKTRTHIAPRCSLAVCGANRHLSEVVEFPRLLFFLLSEYQPSLDPACLAGLCVSSLLPLICQEHPTVLLRAVGCRLLCVLLTLWG